MSRLLFQRFRNVAADNSSGQTFHDRSLADTGIADQHRIIFRATRQHLHDPADFVVAADDWINLSAASQLGQIASVFFQCLIFSFRILIGHALRAAHLLKRLHHFVARDADFLK